MPQVIQREQMTCEREGRESHDAAVLKSLSCQHRIAFSRELCGELPDYCLNCESCGEPFCEKHRTVIDGVVYCGPCARIGVAA